MNSDSVHFSLSILWYTDVHIDTMWVLGKGGCTYDTMWVLGKGGCAYLLVRVLGKVEWEGWIEKGVTVKRKNCKKECLSSPIPEITKNNSKKNYDLSIFD